MCLLGVACGAGGIPIPLWDVTVNGSRGVGVGGQLTFGAGGLRVSVNAAPWTVGSTQVAHQTPSGMTTTRTATGFVHGAASATSTLTTNAGELQLVTPLMVTFQGVAGPRDTIGTFLTLTIRPAPEPGRLLLLGAGSLALVVMGRRRMRSSL